MNARIRWAASAAPVVVCLSLVAGCREAAPDQKAPTPVKAQTVEETGAATLARYSGTLEPTTRVDMAFRVGGYIESLGQTTTADGKRRAIDRGDFVRKGTILARVRSSDYAQRVATANAQVSHARSEGKLAEAELERAKRLFESEAITKADLDVKIARVESARANVDGAVARAGEAGVALDDTVLRAPIDGVVLARAVELGSLVAPGQQAITVADTRTMKAVFGVPQALVETIELGSKVQVYAGAEGEAGGHEKALDAKVSRVAPVADAKGRVFSVEASLDNDLGTLRAGAVVSVHLAGATSAARIAVPLSAVVRSPGTARGFSVFILEGTSDRAVARIREVRLGQVLGNLVTVTRGLSAGERVVTVGSTLLRDGADAVVIR